jgi:hypothetical protein
VGSFCGRQHLRHTSSLQVMIVLAFSTDFNTLWTTLFLVSLSFFHISASPGIFQLA